MRLDDRVFLVDKRPGVTSFAVVRELRRVARLRKVGHCGSLDPMATGLLVLNSGLATRVTAIFMGLAKEYVARVVFGRATDTYDADGRITREAPVPALDAATLRAALRRFEGEIDQVPPMVSALRRGGERLYELARRGEEVERAPRRVLVHGIDLLDHGAEHADVRVRCGRGCYVRSLAHDLGTELGVPAHLGALRRTAIGSLRIEGAATLDELRAWIQAGAGPPAPRAVRSLPEALAFLPRLHVRAAAEAGLRHGVQPLPHHLRESPLRAGDQLLVSEDDQRLLAIGTTLGAGAAAPVRLLLVFPVPVPTAEGD